MSGPSTSINGKDSLHLTYVTQSENPTEQKTYTRLTHLEETSHCNTAGRKLSVR